MGSNKVPLGTYDFGTVSGTKLLLEQNLYNCNSNLSNLNFQVPQLKVTVIVT